MLSPLEVLLIFLVICVVIFIVRNQRFHELADRDSRRFCEQHQLQFLDGTVMFQGVSFDRRRWHFCRSFRFDYSTQSIDRYAGTVTYCGEQIQSYRVHPDHIQAREINSPVADQLEL